MEYTGARSELLACRETAWLGTALTNISPVYDVSGPDAVKFLNYYCVNRDFGQMVPGSSKHAGKIPSELGILAQIICYLPADNYTSYFGDSDLDERGKSTEYYGFFYNRNFEERKNYDVSLVFSTPDELKGLPATDIITAGLDNLIPEGKQYNDLLRENGISGSYHCFEKCRHGFLVNLYDEYC